jgi:hypothetical protein
MSLKKVWYLDIDYKTTPPEVYKIVERMWEERDLGNDVYIIHTDIAILESHGEKDAPLVAYLREHGVTDKELVLLRYAW